MTIMERGKTFLQRLRGLTQRTPWEERQCPACRGHDTWKHGRYRRQLWTLDGRQVVTMQRYLCRRCRRTFTPELAQVARRCRYGRDVRRCALDLWQHGGGSVRRTAEWVRSLLGRQERWHYWRPWGRWHADTPACRLGASTVHHWLAAAGQRAVQVTRRGWADVPSSGQLGADGLWATFQGKTKAVVLLLCDRVTGVLYPPVVVPTEDDPAAWGRLVLGAARAGLRVSRVRGLVSDGTRGLAQFVEQRLVWVHHQRCVFHLWRNLAAPLAAATTTAVGTLRGAAARAVRQATRRELGTLIHAVLDAADDATAVAALGPLAAHRLGAALARALGNALEQALVYQSPVTAGLGRVGPEWHWRDFRLRLSHGRNHRSPARLERAATLWTIYHNFEPAQRRSERKRHYRRSGRSPLAQAGVPPGDVSYLDALAI
jgi:transposase-like protein